MTAATSTPETLTAAERVAGVRPEWRNTVPAGPTLGLREGELLHAGPPIETPEDLCLPLRHAVCAALVFEGLAGNLEAADALLAAGKVRLRPAQDLGVATPLVAVVSSSMWLHAVVDAGQPGRVAYAPLNEGPGPALRFGLATPEVVARLRWVHGTLAPALADLPEAIELLPLAAEALAQGDELHARVGIASGLLADRLHPDRLDEASASFLRGHTHLFLNAWMAACLCMLSAARDYGKGDLVIAAGGNGRTFGIQRSGAPGEWIAAPASPPLGPTLPDMPPTLERLPAIGDSALIDALGLGAMALDAAPAHAANFDPARVAALAETANAVLLARHPVLGRKVGLDAARVTPTHLPGVCLAALDTQGVRGLVGFGIAAHPAALYGMAGDGDA